MSIEQPFLRAALRRLRLESAVALAQQDRMDADVVASLSRQLDEARRVEDAERAEAGPELPLDILQRRLALRPIDEQVLLAAVALERDPLFAITASALAGEEPRLGIHGKLLAQIVRAAGDEALELDLGASHPLVETGLLESTAPLGTPDSLRPWRVAARAIGFLDGNDDIDSLLRRAGGVVTLPPDIDLDHARPTLEMLDRVLRAGEDVIVCIEGLDGVGRRTVVAAAAAAVGRVTVAIDAARLSPDRARCQAELRALRRECWLRGALPVVARLDALSRREASAAERQDEVASALESPGAVRGPAIVTTGTAAELPEFERRVIRLRLESPGPAARTKLWTRALHVHHANGNGNGAAAAGDEERLSAAVQHYALTPGGIQRAAANARMLAQGRAIEAEDIRAGVSAEIQERFGGLATRITISQDWDDLVLPQDTLDDIKSFASRAANAALVYDRWGFRDKLGRGLGLAALFSGPPGTGKTMVAGLIARQLGLELYMVDLSQVVSKWVGETEKQLGKIFDAASMGQALLLFDEADALFAKRTEVKSSNDRYANLEVNYLLQRIERFGGVAILTTNLEGSVDPAFKRRLAAEVRFYPPEREERERLWRTLIPAAAPREEPLDFGVLSEEYKEMCGGHIRNAVLRAAFLAAAEEKPIDQAHLVRAARSEYRAMGKVL